MDSTNITRLHLGASRLEALDPRVLRIFLDKSWLHLGDPERRSEAMPAQRCTVSRLVGLARRHGISYVAAKIIHHLFGRRRKADAATIDVEELYDKTNFREFYYQKGDALPFDDASFDFIFSEHFVEHLFLDEAVSLLHECHRILKPFGVVRTCVPDADLRTYEPPEPIGFPDIALSYAEPAKHKTRWSVYFLAEAVRVAGFEPFPLRYCNKFGEYIRVDPTAHAEAYEGCPEKQMIFDFSYLNRSDSLIVDGIRKR